MPPSSSPVSLSHRAAPEEEIVQILVVDDEPALREVLRAALTLQGHAVRTAHNGAEALAELRVVPADLIVLDWRMPIMDGATFARVYHASSGPHAPLVVLTGDSSGPAAAEGPAAAVLAKPVDLDELLTIIDHPTAVLPDG
jgi:CheY-like chemotaxis protein